jgi:hypothetical protein
MALPSGISGGTSTTSRWFAGISTVCSMVIEYFIPPYSVPLSIAKKRAEGEAEKVKGEGRGYEEMY